MQARTATPCMFYPPHTNSSGSYKNPHFIWVYPKRKRALKKCTLSFVRMNYLFCYTVKCNTKKEAHVNYV